MEPALISNALTVSSPNKSYTGYPFPTSEFCIRRKHASVLNSYSISKTTRVNKNFQVKLSSAFTPSGISSFSASSFYGGMKMSIALGLFLPSLAHSKGKGGALSSEMNVFQRIYRVIQSYLNSFVSMFEDPQKILDQSVLEMNSDLIKMRQATAQVIASQRMIENKCNQSKKVSDEWYHRAKLALEKGDEVLAKEALKRRKSYEENAKSLRSQLMQQNEVVDKLVSSTRALESKIGEAKSKKDVLIARAQSARTSLKVNELIGNVNTSSALAAFEKMEEKVIALEAESDALGQLTSDELSQKFDLLEGDTVESDLVELRKEMLNSSKKFNVLPAPKSFLDLEVESELNELRRKAREF